MLYSLISFALGAIASFVILSRAFARHDEQRRDALLQSAARAVREVIAENATPKYVRCPNCDTAMLAATTPFVAPGSHN